MNEATIKQQGTHHSPGVLTLPNHNLFSYEKYEVSVYDWDQIPLHYDFTIISASVASSNSFVISPFKYPLRHLPYSRCDCFHYLTKVSCVDFILLLCLQNYIKHHTLIIIHFITINIHVVFLLYSHRDCFLLTHCSQQSFFIFFKINFKFFHCFHQILYIYNLL